jgi:hypothetical protein
LSDQPPIKILEPGDGPEGAIDWDTVTEDELRQRAFVFSYRLNVARKKLRVQPIWVRFITAHIYVDHILTTFIKDNTPNPAALVKSTGRRKYLVDKLEICEAMAWVPKDLATVIKRLNTLRNGFAHDLNFEVPRSEITNFQAVFPKPVKELVEETLALKRPGARDNELSMHLEVFLVTLDLQRQGVLLRRYLARHRERELGKAMLNARRVLQAVEGSRANISPASAKTHQSPDELRVRGAVPINEFQRP